LSLIAPEVHAVQFYDDEDFLVETVGRYLAAGLDAGERVIVIASDQRRSSFMRYLVAHWAHMDCETERAILLSANDTLSAFMRDGMPDPAAFRAFIAATVRAARAGGEISGVRAYGEMVDVLWRSGNAKGAIQLEELWQEAAQIHGFALLCAYAMGNFDEAGDIERFLEICDKHSHVLPTEDFTELLEALGHPNEGRCLPRHEGTQTETDVAFRKLLLGALGRELRHPLNTLLTTARLILSDPDSASRVRLERMVSSGARMRRAIDQIADLTHAGLPESVPVRLKDDQAVGLLVAKVVEEIRAANPGRYIELHAKCPCITRLDPDRFRQVVSTLVDNALEHGDESTIAVTVTGTPAFVRVSVHNYGLPIDATLIPLLFDPFRRAAALRPRNGSLGLGLYICDRIVAAHGGRIDVHSSADEGTCFEVVIPTRT
jgi:signal transduction histidine kinase